MDIANELDLQKKKFALWTNHPSWEISKFSFYTSKFPGWQTVLPSHKAKSTSWRWGSFTKPPICNLRVAFFFYSLDIWAYISSPFSDVIVRKSSKYRNSTLLSPSVTLECMFIVLYHSSLILLKCVHGYTLTLCYKHICKRNRNVGKIVSGDNTTSYYSIIIADLSIWQS